MKQNNWLKYAATLMPYAAVLIGLYALQNAWVTILLYHICIVLLLIGSREKNLFRRLFSGVNYRALVVSVMACALSGPLIYVLWRYMILNDATPGTLLMNYGLHGRSWFLFMIYFSSIHPILEELFWRGLNFDRGRNNRGLSLVDFCFAGYHILVLLLFIKLPWVILSFIVVSAAAWSWRQAARKFQGLAVPLLSHVVADCSIVVTVNVLI